MERTATKERGPQQTTEFAKISVNRGCYERIKRLSQFEGKTLSGFLDNISQILASNEQTLQLTVETPQQQVMARMAGFEKKLDSIGEDLDAIYTRLLDTPKTYMNDCDRRMIVEALREDPAVKRVGWFIRLLDDSWQFDFKGFEAWAAQEDARKDALQAEFKAQNELKRGKRR